MILRLTRKKIKERTKIRNYNRRPTYGIIKDVDFDRVQDNCEDN